MTNEMIILNERLRLLDEGVIKSTGRMLEFTDDAGEAHKYEEPEEIHSFSYWKENAGRVVKKGSKAIAAFPIWVPKKNRKNEEEKKKIEDENMVEDETSLLKKKMYLKQTFFFTYEQTEEYKR